MPVIVIELNIKPYRNITSYDMINSLLETNKLVKVQRDELLRLSKIERVLYREEREYVVRLYNQKITGACQ